MARTVAGTLTLPVVGSPLANAEIFFTAKRTEATAILKGVSTSFKTDSSGAYSASIVNGYYAVSVSYSLPGVSQARRYPLGDVVVSDGGTVTLNALLAVNGSAADPVDEALLQLVADAQQARDQAVTAAETLEYADLPAALAGTSSVGIMPPSLVHAAFKQYGLGSESSGDLLETLNDVPSSFVRLSSGAFGATGGSENVHGVALVSSVTATRAQAIWTSGHPSFATRIFYKSTNDGWATDSGAVEFYTDANVQAPAKALMAAATEAAARGAVGAAPAALDSYTVATVPSASARARQTIYVSNESGGPVPAFSDGANWRRVTDRAVIS